MATMGRGKKRQSHRTIFLDLSEMNQRGTSGTNDKVKGCAGPITSDRPLFWPLEKSLDPFHRARASFVVQEFTLSFGLASWIPDNRKNLVPLRTIGRPAFPREDQLFVPLRCVSISRSPDLFLLFPPYPPSFVPPTSSPRQAVSFCSRTVAHESIRTFLGKFLSGANCVKRESWSKSSNIVFILFK